jgi:hypothetical protein
MITTTMVSSHILINFMFSMVKILLILSGFRGRANYDFYTYLQSQPSGVVKRRPAGTRPASSSSQSAPAPSDGAPSDGGPSGGGLETNPTGGSDGTNPESGPG